MLDVSDQALDEALTSGGWVRNESKRELVLDLRWKGLARKMQDGQLRGGIVASARHLGNQYIWNGRKRANAAHEGSAEGLWIDGRASGLQREGGASEERPSWERSWVR